jgi:hypothetical protein
MEKKQGEIVTDFKAIRDVVLAVSAERSKSARAKPAPAVHAWFDSDET